MIGPAVDFLHSPTEKLRRAMIPAMDGDPNVTAKSVIAALEASSVKIYVNNYRMNELPPTIKKYLHSHFTHLWGSIYIYAPEVSAGKQKLTIKFPGNYRITSTHKNHVMLNGKYYKPDTMVYLSKGNQMSNAAKPYRLTLVPEINGLNPAFKSDNWKKITLFTM